MPPKKKSKFTQATTETTDVQVVAKCFEPPWSNRKKARERMKEYRASQSLSQIEEIRDKDRSRHAQNRATEDEDTREQRRAEDRKRVAERRATENEVVREQRRADNRKRDAERRAAEDKVVQEQRRAKNRKRNTERRVAEDNESRQQRRLQNRQRNKKQRATEGEEKRDQRRAEDRQKKRQSYKEHKVKCIDGLIDKASLTHICVSECRYRPKASMVLVSYNVYTADQKKLLLLTDETKSIDGNHYVCRACRDCIKKNRIPACNESNMKFRIPKLPPQFQTPEMSLSKLEANLLKLVIPFIRIVHLPGSA